MNFRQLPLSLSSLFSFTSFSLSPISLSYYFAPISDSVDTTSQASTFVVSVLILNRRSRVPLLRATFTFLPSSVSIPLPRPQTAAAASHSNDNEVEVETHTPTWSFSDDFCNSNSVLSSVFPHNISVKLLTVYVNCYITCSHQYRSVAQSDSFSPIARLVPLSHSLTLLFFFPMMILPHVFHLGYKQYSHAFTLKKTVLTCSSLQ